MPIYSWRNSRQTQIEEPTEITQFSSVQSLRQVWLFTTPWTAACQVLYPSPTPGACSNSCPLSQWCHPTLSSLLLLLSVFPSIRVFSNESVLCIRWPKYWSFSFSISPSNEYSELISFRMDWLDLLAVQGTLKSLLQHHSSKASILRHSASYRVRFLLSFCSFFLWCARLNEVVILSADDWVCILVLFIVWMRRSAQDAAGGWVMQGPVFKWFPLC